MIVTLVYTGMFERSQTAASNDERVHTYTYVTLHVPVVPSRESLIPRCRNVVSCDSALQQRTCCSVRTTVIPLWPVDYLQRNGRVCEARQCIIFFGLPRREPRTNPLEPPLPTGLQRVLFMTRSKQRLRPRLLLLHRYVALHLIVRLLFTRTNQLHKPVTQVDLLPAPTSLSHVLQSGSHIHTFIKLAVLAIAIWGNCFDKGSLYLLQYSCPQGLHCGRVSKS